MSSEPVLTDMDHRIWDDWCMQVRLYAKTSTHKRAVDRSLRIVHEFYRDHPEAYLAWSAGKDSTAMTHLAVVGAGLDIGAMSVKDDLDFPGEEEYLTELASDWGVDLEIVRPSFSLQDWIAQMPPENAVADMHSRASAFAKEAFYAPVEAFSERMGKPGVYLGLRQDESRARRMNRATRGMSYQKRSGEWVCQPIADWSGMDVYAYLISNETPILPVYQCVRLHESPERVRKSWWLPGEATRHGQSVWLRAYYPTLFRRLLEIMPSASTTA